MAAIEGRSPSPTMSTTFECCGRTFRNAEAYAEHWFKAHPTLLLMCCNVNFISADDYARHEKVEQDVG
ncbi:MAG TPA: hypothetical protein VFF30_06825 [Nitrososphaerales archaeon]|nr:hypothetical protein [Nitrososphaerales archaeon]